MSFTCKKSFNNSSFNKADRKAVGAHDASEKDDGGAAISIAMDHRIAPRQFKEVHRAPSESLRTPDKAILKVDESKLVARKDDDLGFAIKSDKKSPNAPLKAPKPAKQNLAAELFAHASCSAAAAVSRLAESTPAPKIVDEPQQPQQPASRWSFARK